MTPCCQCDCGCRRDVEEGVYLCTFCVEKMHVEGWELDPKDECG